MRSILIALVFVIAALGITVAEDKPVLPHNVPEVSGHLGMWSPHDIVRPHRACWGHKSFIMIQEALDLRDSHLYKMLMVHPKVQCVDRLFTPGPNVPVSLRKMLSQKDMPELGYQLQFWSGKYGPMADKDVWLWVVLPYGVLKHHGKPVPEGAVLWPESYNGWRPGDPASKPKREKYNWQPGDGSLIHL